MQFISNGDFGLPFTWPIYLVQQFYFWSFQSGAINPNGIIRMPGRLLDLLVFMLLGNIATSYFYLISTIIVVFLSFYFFALKFLDIKNLWMRIIGSLFFALNPIYLGNFSKIGLVFAAAMLPFCLLAIKIGFEKKQFRYFVFLILALNLSFVHPFTFAINLGVSMIYFLFLANENLPLVKKNIYKLLGIIFLAVLLNSYFLLPIASMRAVSKDAISNTVSSEPTDFTSLVNVLNTGDIYTGLSLSKNVVLDYNFYNKNYEKTYFIGVFSFYILIIGLYLHVDKRITDENRRKIIILFASFLALILFATVTFLNFSKVIDMLIQLPGGWAFRSPLKWQLYIPLPLISLLVILTTYIEKPVNRRILYSGLILIFLIMNGFISYDIYKKLLLPRKVETFAALQNMNLDHKNALFITNSDCISFQSDNPRIMTEFNQVMNSKLAQLKYVNYSNLDKLNIKSYDYIFSCTNSLPQTSASNFNFEKSTEFAKKKLILYKNSNPINYMTVVPDLINSSSVNLLNKYEFSTQVLKKNFNIVNNGNMTVSYPTTGLQDIFENLSFNDLGYNEIAKSYIPLQTGYQKLYSNKQKQVLYYKQSPKELSIQTTKQIGFKKLPAVTDISLPSKLLIHYKDPSYTKFVNLINNPSFEKGSWQSNVGDCYNYDDYPEIRMGLIKTDKTDGQQSLLLASGNHVACVKTNKIQIKSQQQYLLSFDYKSLDGSGGYYISFNDSNRTSISDRLNKSTPKWKTYTKVISAPVDASTMRLTIDAYPDGASGGVGSAQYDNFKLAAIPDIQNRFYLVSDRDSGLKVPSNFKNHFVAPTKTIATVTGASKPFFIISTDSYNSHWRLELNNAASSSIFPVANVRSISNKEHIQINNSMNGWYVDPTALCKDIPTGCTKNSDGSYNISLVAEFTPQRWFYIGSIISAITLIGCIGYFVFSKYRPPKTGKGSHYVARR